MRTNIFFTGIVRDWTAVFQFESTYLALHHFVTDLPDRRMIDNNSGLKWDQLIEPEGVCAELFGYLKEQGFLIEIPIQAFLDAYLSEMAGIENWHLSSPKHKLMIWCHKEDMSFLIEMFFSQPFAPYGIKESREWPNLEDVLETFQLTLWEEVVPEKKRKKPAVVAGEDLVVGEKVPEEIEQFTDKAIERIFKENTIVCANFSGGKDSSVIIQKCIRYKMEHPESSARLIILSADTGGADLPLMRQHIR
ncbi:adenine nucleotide alpha hydrolase family protein [Paenibacillus aestuarii]|uniref:Phosphoadenosine phosphosulphate reductase domain-containing protein n=1 Tax=Paenibacillus aestuarii TaxID=516965 RepID=A0ABW0KG40_9BACL|nr:hypothetical protein [Paenibacillus aestuarii]